MQVGIHLIIFKKQSNNNKTKNVWSADAIISSGEPMCAVKSCYCIKRDLFSRGPDLLQDEVHFGHRFSLALR